MKDIAFIYHKEIDKKRAKILKEMLRGSLAKLKVKKVTLAWAIPRQKLQEFKKQYRGSNLVPYFFKGAAIFAAPFTEIDRFLLGALNTGRKPNMKMFHPQNHLLFTNNEISDNKIPWIAIIFETNEANQIIYNKKEYASSTPAKSDLKEEILEPLGDGFALETFLNESTVKQLLAIA